jgi:protein-L-isoaspartate(D-aspartate) O-methyltransferase
MVQTSKEDSVLKSASRSYVIFGLIVLSVSIFFLYSRTLSKDVSEFDIARAAMIEDLSKQNITDPRVLEVMGEVPRHLFVCPWLIDGDLGELTLYETTLPRQLLEKEAYVDHGLPIAEGQSISQPYVVALMTESLMLNGSERVLEIGTGSGYQAAVLAELSDEVYTMEIREMLAKSAEERLKVLGYNNVHVKWADGYYGWEEYAPFDAIIITAAVNHVPPSLIKQLKDGGRLVLPLGSVTYYQTITLIEKRGDDLIVNYIIKANFVPMVGEALEAGG